MSGNQVQKRREDVMTSSPDTPVMDAGHTRDVQLSSLRRSFPFALFGSTLIAVMSANVLHGVVPSAELWSWLGVFLFTSVCRLAALIHYTRNLSRPGASERWLKQMTIGNLISG